MCCGVRRSQPMVATEAEERQPPSGDYRQRLWYFRTEMAITRELRGVVEEGQTLSLLEATNLMRRVLAGEVADLELAALLGAMGARGETAAEIAGFALALREAATTLPLTQAERETLVDTCGTGGDGSGTFNISTTAALIAAAAGARVAKHGNRAVTSKCGSADVLEALGIPISLSPDAAAEALRHHRFCFLLAPAHHPGMRATLPVRKALGVRTVFNVLGPLLNPAGARRQVMGVYNARLVPTVAEAMTYLQVEHGFVVHGDGGLDELSLSGPSHVAVVRGTGQTKAPEQFTITPEEAGFTRAPLAALAGGEDAQENATILRKILGLDGEVPEMGARRDIAVLNAAAVLVAAGLADTIPVGADIAARTIDAGAMQELVDNLRGSVTRGSL